MARALTPHDAHVIMGLLVKEATGQDETIQIVNSSDFVSAGERVLATGLENTLNALSIVVGRTFMAVRPYEAKLKIINAINSGLYNSRVRKISFYSREAQASGDWNTQLNTMNLADGRDNTEGSGNATGSMWVQNRPVPLEMNFAGQSVWEDSTTIYENQLKVAFNDESTFLDFISGIMTEKGNDIESQKEAFNRMSLLNHIAGVYDMGASMNGSVINLTEGFNAKFGTSYTSEELRSTHLKDFLAYFVEIFKITSDKMTHRSVNFHWSPTKTIGDKSYKLLRHTPKADQRAILYNPLFVSATAQVLPTIFSPSYLGDITQGGELVDFWQNENDPSAISVIPAIPDTTTGVQKAGTAVSLPYVVGMLYDKDALMVDYQFESAESTPLEARKRYRNIWWTFSKNAINDFTENAVIFIMKDTEA